MVFEDAGHTNRENIRQQLEDIFHRDWTSEYAHYLNTTKRKLIDDATELIVGKKRLAN